MRGFFRSSFLGYLGFLLTEKKLYHINVNNQPRIDLFIIFVLGLVVPVVDSLVKRDSQDPFLDYLHTIPRNMRPRVSDEVGRLPSELGLVQALHT